METKSVIWALQIDYAAYKAEDKNSKLNYTRAYSPVLRSGAKDYLAGTMEEVGGRGISIIMPTMYTRGWYLFGCMGK